MQIDGKRPFAIEYETDDACRPVYIAVFFLILIIYLTINTNTLLSLYSTSSYRSLSRKEKKIDGIEAAISLN